MKKILVPTDFSKRANEALDFAVQLSSEVQGNIVLMHILDFPSSSFNTTGEMNQVDPEIIFQGEYIKGVQKRLEKVREQY